MLDTKWRILFVDGNGQRWHVDMVTSTKHTWFALVRELSEHMNDIEQRDSFYLSGLTFYGAYVLRQQNDLGPWGNEPSKTNTSSIPLSSREKAIQL